MVCLGRCAWARLCAVGIGMVVLGGGLVPAVAWGAVTSITAGTGISLSSNPCTSTCTVQLATGWALTNPLSTPLFKLTNTGTGDALDVTGPVGVRATVNGAGHYAVLAHGGNAGVGVLSYGGPSTGVGVEGLGSGSSQGIVGFGGTTAGVGVEGAGRATNAYGVAGYGTGTDAGVYGRGGSNGGDGGTFVTSGEAGFAVFGNDTSSGGFGGFFQSANGVGVYGTTRANGAWGVAGSDASPSGGLAGNFTSDHGTGISATGGGANPAIRARGGGSGGDGVDATAGASANGAGGSGMAGTGGNSAGCQEPDPAGCILGYTGGAGVVGTGGQGAPGSSTGLNAPGFGGAGVQGTGSSAVDPSSYAGAGVQAIGGPGTASQRGGSGIEAYGGADGGDGEGVAGDFSGDVNVRGNLWVTGSILASTKDFKIDDPRDPANKYLVHTSVESPDAETVYNGNITTDAKGYATVALPAYFDAENIDPRYQLTVIGAFAQAVVWRQESHNQFTIRTGHGHVTVSWQVTGIRNDPYARSVRAPAEQAKAAADRGRYLYPAGYGRPASAAIDQAPRPTVAKPPSVPQSRPPATPTQRALPPAPTSPSSP
jgi:hypothetical protein